jgi:DNA-binding response OmpR family regulator
LSVPSHARILIVEDEALIAVTIEDILFEHGYDVIGIASSVAEAMEMLKHRPHLIVLDVKLGSETSLPVLLRCQKLGIGVVLTTGYSRSELPDGFSQLPLLSKPYAIDDLCETVNKAAEAARVDKHRPPHIERLVHPGSDRHV